jgi:glycosyltransferase involved in cell wall biosynthesis
MKVLFLTFFESVMHNGIYDSQVKNLLCKLAAGHPEDVEVSHLAFLPAVEIGRGSVRVPIFSERPNVSALTKEFRQHGVQARVTYLPVVLAKRWTFHFHPLLLSFLWLLAVPLLLWKVIRGRYDVIHCRSYVATLLAVSVKAALRNVEVVFDPRGFYPEEGVVHRRWKEGSWTFRFWKAVERQLLCRSDRSIALSETFAEHLHCISGQAKCSVIYAGADLRRFRQQPEIRAAKRRELRLEEKTVFAYNGGLGSWHDPELLAQVYKAIRRGIPDSQLLVVTPYSREKLDKIFTNSGLEKQDYTIVSAEPQEVPAYLMAADFGIVPLRKILGEGAIHVVADTMIGLKVAEYLASSLPLVVNQDVHGIHSLMTGFRIGVYFDSAKLEEVVPEIRRMQQSYVQHQAHCEQVVGRYFSIDQAVESYYHVYQEIMSRPFGTCEKPIAIREELTK